MRSVVSVGVFDGLHLGHQAILETALAAARARGARFVVVSFEPHPAVVLEKVFRPIAPLTPLPEKRARLEAMGVERFEVLPFTRELAALSAEEFVERHLVAPFAPEVLVVGANFALGRGRSGDVGRLAELGRAHGFRLEAVPLLEREGAVVSSTRIRGLLAEGQVAGAARLLGRRYSLTGRVVTGNGVGRTLGVPTANLRLHEEKFVPGHGIYAVWARIGGEDTWRPAAMSVGVRPTFGGRDVTLEVHLLDWQGELPGKEIEVEFADWLRPELRFEGVEELKAAMGRDLEDARRLLRAGAAAPGAATGA